MTEDEQLYEFQREIEKIINRFCDEFELSFASMIGVLEIVKGDLIASYQDSMNDDSEEEDGDNEGEGWKKATGQ